MWVFLWNWVYYCRSCQAAKGEILKYKCTLEQPAVCNTPYAECEIEADEGETEDKIIQKAALKLMSNFRVYVVRSDD